MAMGRGKGKLASVDAEPRDECVAARSRRQMDMEELDERILEERFNGLFGHCIVWMRMDYWLFVMRRIVASHGEHFFCEPCFKGQQPPVFVWVIYNCMLMVDGDDEDTFISKWGLQDGRLGYHEKTVLRYLGVCIGVEKMEQMFMAAESARQEHLVPRVLCIQRSWRQSRAERKNSDDDSTIHTFLQRCAMTVVRDVFIGDVGDSGIEPEEYTMDWASYACVGQSMEHGATEITNSGLANHGLIH